MALRGMNVVSIGGGLGAVQVMQGLKSHTESLTGIIAVTDTGRSTGIVREFAQIPGARRHSQCPGHAQRRRRTRFWRGSCNTASSRPGDPKLDGMAFGNLFIAALTQMSGSFVMAIQQISDFLEVQANSLSGYRREYAYLRRTDGWHHRRAGISMCVSWTKPRSSASSCRIPKRQFMRLALTRCAMPI